MKAAGTASSYTPQDKGGGDKGGAGGTGWSWVGGVRRSGGFHLSAVSSEGSEAQPPTPEGRLSRRTSNESFRFKM